ncbi:MAG TPA: hypothetical protein VM425_21065 [Myxococcota bacterium]|nr:hypothetical protein [Myxococcota bacterium]
MKRVLRIPASIVFLIGAACLLPACSKGSIGNSDAGADGMVDDGDGMGATDDGGGAGDESDGVLQADGDDDD